MAQEKKRSQGRRAGTARRYGFSGWGLPAVVLVAVAALAAGIYAFTLGGAPLTIERGQEEAVADGAEPAEDTEAGSESGGEGEAGSDGEAAEPALVVVHVDGAVGAPGVYELTAGSRVADAVELAGGLTEKADTSTLNLALVLTDGEKVYVPEEGEAVPQVTTGETSSSGGLININTATADELETLPGVGEATAAAIIEDRESNGPFSAPEDLMRVSGIGEKKFARIEGMICV